jgi:hypothetical protein
LQPKSQQKYVHHQKITCTKQKITAKYLAYSVPEQYQQMLVQAMCNKLQSDTVQQWGQSGTGQGSALAQ